MGITDLPAPDVVAKAQGLFEQLTRNAALFPLPVPSLPVFRAHISSLFAANAEVASNGGKREHQAKQEALRQVRADIKCLAAYVQVISNGDADKILASGFAVARRSSPRGELTPPRKLRSLHSTRDGRVKFQWEGDDGTALYQVFRSYSNAPFQWEMIGASTKRSFHADNLEPGTIYWFAVSAVGAAGESSKSEPLMARAN